VVWHKRDFRDTLPVKLALRPYHASMLFAIATTRPSSRWSGASCPRQAGILPRAGRSRGGGRCASRSWGRPAQAAAGPSPGANWATKRWPVERFAGLARRALERGFRVAVQGSASEAPLERPWPARPGRSRSLGQARPARAGRLHRPLHRLRGQRQRSDAHGARAGRPYAGVLRVTDPPCSTFAAMKSSSRDSLRPCSFFGRRRCPRGHFRCMLDLTEERAWGALSPLLSAGRLRCSRRELAARAAADGLQLVPDGPGRRLDLARSGASRAGARRAVRRRHRAPRGKPGRAPGPGRSAM